MSNTKFSRITITLPPDLAAWVKQKQAELEAQDRRLTTSVSAIISDAVAEMKARDDESTPQPAGQAMPDLGKALPLPHGGKSKIVTPSAGGYSTRKPKPSRKAG